MWLLQLLTACEEARRAVCRSEGDTGGLKSDRGFCAHDVRSVVGVLGSRSKGHIPILFCGKSTRINSGIGSASGARKDLGVATLTFGARPFSGRGDKRVMWRPGQARPGFTALLARSPFGRVKWYRQEESQPCRKLRAWCWRRTTCERLPCGYPPYTTLRLGHGACSCFIHSRIIA